MVLAVWILATSLVGAASGSSTSHVSIDFGEAMVKYDNDHEPQPASPYHPEPPYHPQPPYHPPPKYPSHPPPSYPPQEPSYPPPHEPSYTPKPSYSPKPSYIPKPSYSPKPSYHPKPVHPKPTHHEPKIPACADLTNATYCLEDEEYPEYDIKHAIQYHLDDFNHLYADVADLDTVLSVERPESLEEETYLCSSETSYIRPLRAKNTDGKWRVIVNEIQLHYKTFTQTTRVEECLTAGEECPKVPICYESACLQKSIYHRFLVYDPYDHYFPFAIESFKLPASCACLLGAYTIDH